MHLSAEGDILSAVHAAIRLRALLKSRPSAGSRLRRPVRQDQKRAIMKRPSVYIATYVLTRRVTSAALCAIPHQARQARVGDKSRSRVTWVPASSNVGVSLHAIYRYSVGAADRRMHCASCATARAATCCTGCSCRACSRARCGRDGRSATSGARTRNVSLHAAPTAPGCE